MESRYVYKILLCLSFAFAIWITLEHPTLPQHYINQAAIGYGWNLTTHSATNATFWWLGFAHSLTSPLSDLLFWVESSLLLLLLIALGLSLTPNAKWEITIASLSCLLILFRMFGPDIVAVNFLIQFLSVLYLYRALRSDLATGLWISPCVATCSLLLCSQWSYLTLIANGILILQFKDQARKEQLSIQHTGALVVIALFLGLATNIQLQRPAIPHFGYPATGRVVPDDGIAGITTPLIGEMSEIPYIDRTQIKTALKAPIQGLALFGLLLFLFSSRAGKRQITLALMFIAVLFWDLAIPETLAHIGPLKSFRRILPGLFPLPMSVYCFQLMLCLLMTEVLANRIRLITFLAIFGATAYSLPPLLGAPPAPSFSHSGFSALSDMQVLASPSLHLLRTEGVELMPRLKLKSSFIAHSAHELHGTISVSHQPKRKFVKLLSDRRLDTRWSPSRGAQYGDEWIRVTFDSPITIEGLQLLPGRFFSDFARGIKVTNCATTDGQGSELKRIPVWQGGIEISPQGYPYYSGQHEFTVVLPEPATTTCIQINQIAEDTNYDWSVAELKILTR